MLTVQLDELGGHAIQPLHGESVLGMSTGKEWTREQPVFFEHEGNCAIRQNSFKLVRQHNCDWELCDMDADRTELNTLSGSNQQVERNLLREYQGWASKSGVMDWNLARLKLLDAWNIESAEG